MDASQIAKLPTPSLKKVLLFLYGYQTVEEQMSEGTIELNNMGFNRIDAEILSSYSEQVKEGKELSEKQYNVMRLRLPKYWRQVPDNIEDRIKLPEVISHNGGAKNDYSQLRILFHGESPQARAANSTLLDFAIENEDRFNKHIRGKSWEEWSGLPSSTAGILSIDDKGCLMFQPNVYPSKQIKDLGFKFWDGKAWHQIHPKVYQTVVDEIRKMFGDITVDPSVMEALKPKEPVQLPIWVNDLFPSLHPFQKEAIQFTAAHDRLLLALAPRLGKTVVTVISADVVKAERILVVAPLSLLRDWKNKILKWSLKTAPEDVAIVYKKNVVVPSRWTVTNYDTLRLHPETFNLTPWDMIIVDETLLIKNRKAKRTQWIYELINKKLPYSKRNDKKQDPLLAQTKSVFATGLKPPKHVWFLSGAPTSKLYTDLWAQLNILDPNRFSSYWKFADDYCIVQETQWTKYNLVANKPDAAERIKTDLSEVFYTRSHADVTDMPPLEPESLGVQMSSSQEKLYTQMENEFLAELSEDDTLLAPNILAQLLRLVQIASNPLLIGGRDDSAKWDALIEMLGYEARPTIVWTSFIKTVEGIQYRLLSKEMHIEVLTGATHQEKRAGIVEAFQGGKVDVLIAHPAVGKFGLDLFNAQSVIYLERGYNADDYYQSLMRVRHVDQKIAPHIVHLLSERKEGGETIDHIVDKILASRTDATKKLTTVGLKQMMGVLK